MGLNRPCGSKYLRKCNWGIVDYHLEGDSSQTVFGSIGMNMEYEWDFNGRVNGRIHGVC